MRATFTSARFHCTAVKKRDSRKPEAQVQIGRRRVAEIPGSDQRLDPADQIVYRQKPNAAGFECDPAVGGIVAVVAHHEQMVRRHGDFGHVVERADAGMLENRMAAIARQGLDVARRGMQRAIFGFDLAAAVRL